MLEMLGTFAITLSACLEKRYPFLYRAEVAFHIDYKNTDTPTIKLISYRIASNFRREQVSIRVIPPGTVTRELEFFCSLYWCACNVRRCLSVATVVGF